MSQHYSSCRCYSEFMRGNKEQSSCTIFLISVKGIDYLNFYRSIPLMRYCTYVQAVVCFEIRYNPPDGSCSSYAVSEIMEDEQQMLIDIEQNIANLERSLEQANSSSTSGKRRGSWHTPEKTSKKGFLPRGTSTSTSEKSPDTRKR